MARIFSKISVFIVTTSLICGGLLPTTVVADVDKVETGRLLATLLDTGRITVGLHQALINDPSKGHKGFTPEVFGKKVVALYKEETGVDLSNLEQAQVPKEAKPLLARLLEESKKTVQSYQTVINIPGIKYKGLIPATFGTETAKRFQNWSKVYLKQTAPDHLLRNPKNKADRYEAKVMQNFSGKVADDGDKIISKTVEEEKSVRVMLPLYYKKNCLICHGGPKGEQDVSGYKKEGGKLGELAGAISVKLPLE